MELHPTMMSTLLAANLLSTMYMVGLIWFVQVVHYPLMADVSGEGYQRYQERHMRLTSLVVGPPMLIEAASACALALALPAGLGATLGWAALTLLGVVWLSTALFQVPAHQKLLSGFDADAHGRLVGTNWIRTLAWTGRAVLLVVLCLQVSPSV